ncbi:hypothetical protein BDV93DRAFT_524781 [Ceratobasidium sp. AG-I]|nr:hypothetical protein BDV93DRAFT_524781 [Ceratobasidium sp. AG-I]
MAATCAESVVDMCNKVTSNPDISGIGVRSAIYAQTLLNMVVASFMPNDNQLFRNIARSTYILSGSLLASCVAQWKTGGLSLFDALVSTMLTTLMTAFLTVNFSYIKKLGFSVTLASVGFFTLWCYWGIQIWSDPSSFGLEPAPPSSDTTSSLTSFSNFTSAPTSLFAPPSIFALDPSIANCTANIQTQFVVFGHSVPATNSGLRVWALIVFSVGAVTALGGWAKCIWWGLMCWIKGVRQAKEDEVGRMIKEDEFTADAGAGKTRVSFMGGLTGLIYMIVTTEQFVHRNPDVQENLGKWTFGQTLGVIMLAQQLVEIVEYWANRRRVKVERTGKRRSIESVVYDV